MKRFSAVSILVIGLAPAALAQASPETPLALSDRPRLLAYPGGPLEWLRAAGIDLKGSIALSYQGLTAGDGAKDWQDGGKADLWITLDGERPGLWEGFSVAIHPEVTFGDSANDTGAGLLTPPNPMLAFPSLAAATPSFRWSSARTSAPART